MSFVFSFHNHVRIFASLVRLCRAPKVNGFQHIRFSLCIITVQHIRSFMKMKFFSFIITKITHFNGL